VHNFCKECHSLTRGLKHCGTSAPIRELKGRRDPRCGLRYQEAGRRGLKVAIQSAGEGSPQLFYTGRSSRQPLWGVMP